MSRTDHTRSKRVPDTTKVTVRIDQDTSDKLQELAYEKSSPGYDISVSHLVRWALADKYDEIEIREGLK